MSQSFLGTAVAFPLRPNGRGSLVVVSEVEAVENSIRAIIESIKGSHIMEPFLGVPSFAFKPIADLAAVGAVIEDALIWGDDRLEPDTLKVNVAIGDEGLMQVNIFYQIRGEAIDRTLEHSFRSIP
ncbi:MAG: hypothetical protein AB1631_15790 [Acidobacteriota bacterium]